MNVLLKLAALAIALASVTAQPAIPGPQSRFEFSWIFNTLTCAQRLAPNQLEITATQFHLLICVVQVDLVSIIKEIIESLSRKKRAAEGENTGDIQVSDLPPIKEVYAKLKERGLVTELLKLRNCMADRLGFLTDDDKFDTEAFGKYLVGKVKGTNVEDKTQLGATECDEVEDFDIAPYLLCVTTYCITGQDSFE